MAARSGAPLRVLAALLGCGIAAPLVLLARTSFRDDSASWTLANYRLLTATPTYLHVLVRTYLISLVATLAATVLGVLLAVLLARLANRYLRATALCLVAVPAVLNLVMTALAWLVLLQDRRGLVGHGLRLLGLPPSWLYLTPQATVLGLIYLCLPVTTLPSYVGISRARGTLTDAAATLGAGRATILRTVSLPLAAGPIAVGAVISFTVCVGAYVLPETLGGPQNTLIAFFVQDAAVTQFNTGLASALGMLVLVTALPALVLGIGGLGRVSSAR
jgi:ABC-type spermidine/putrescine transport system permease subunit I